MNITLPDGGKIELEDNSTILDAAKKISNSLAKKAVAGVVNDKNSTVAEELDLSEPTLDNVYQGMRMVATSGGPSEIYDKLNTPVACKTGTSEVDVNGVRRNNGFLITYAPYKNPEISVSSVVELAGSGSETAEITAEIIKYWYQNNTDAKDNQKVGTILY